jgi:hypothetical protein
LDGSVLLVSLNPFTKDQIAYGFLSNLGRLLFTLAETDNGLEIDLVGEGKDDLEPSFIVLGFLAVFLESDDDLGLDHQLKNAKHRRAYLARLGTGELDGSVQILPKYRQSYHHTGERDILQIKGRGIEGFLYVTASCGTRLVVDLLQQRLGFPDLINL